MHAGEGVRDPHLDAAVRASRAERVLASGDGDTGEGVRTSETG